MRIIDADALQKSLARLWYDSEITFSGVAVSELINNAPTVDAVQVVRCKDCKHYEDGMMGYCWETQRGVAEDFFCAYGERGE